MISNHIISMLLDCDRSNKMKTESTSTLLLSHPSTLTSMFGYSREGVKYILSYHPCNSYFKKVRAAPTCWGGLEQLGLTKGVYGLKFNRYPIHF